ncbi:hypothetical protein BB561_005146 [Smittium simulii]|uniref:Uncharacterized protein n=1 Tax=Smittium simulii TaxID=133385 RepID=A0A2T9YC20_9FUNG|nr:hypothetical protein BB561_005146 [Smittium simulii]
MILSTSFKSVLKKFTIPSYNKLKHPKTLELNFCENNSTYKFIKRMSELGDVVKYEISKDNLIVSHNLISEFTRFSQDILVMDGAAFKTNVDFFYRPMDILFQHRGARALGEIFSTIYLHKFIQLDSIFYEEIIKRVVRRTSMELNNGKIQ